MIVCPNKPTSIKNYEQLPIFICILSYAIQVGEKFKKRAREKIEKEQPYGVLVLKAFKLID